MPGRPKTRAKAAAETPAKRPRKRKERSKPKVWANYTSRALVQRIAEAVRNGVPAAHAGLREGLSETTVSTWISRWRTEATEAAEAMAKGERPKPPSALAKAVWPIACARGEWLCNASLFALAGDAGAMWALPRRAPDVWGNAQTVTLDAPDPGKAVAALLGKLAGGDPATGD